MNKVFLYLYPIEEYFKMFLFTDESYYDEWNVPRPLPILNESITKRYRDNGYKVVIAIYPDKEIFGIKPEPTDLIIETDVLFSEASGYNSDGSEKPLSEVKYPSEEYIISKLGEIDELVVGGFHFSDCVKRVAEYANSIGINTLVDLDMTDLFFAVYRHPEYFKIEAYSPENYMEYILGKLDRDNERRQRALAQFYSMYKSPIYGMPDEKKLIK